MALAISFIQITSSILLVTAILLQNRGTGLSATFGGEGNVYRTKRGMEKVLFQTTIALAVIFLTSSLAAILLPR